MPVLPCCAQVLYGLGQQYEFNQAGEMAVRSLCVLLQSLLLMLKAVTVLMPDKHRAGIVAQLHV
jgi:hypothetical protein